MKHHDDGGTLTFFADKERGLIACDKGHYWTFDVERHEVEKDPSPKVRERLREDLDRFGGLEVMDAIRPGLDLDGENGN